MTKIKSFDLDLSDIPQAGEIRSFSIVGDNGAQFKLEVRNEDDYYYNFTTELFQVLKASLETRVSGEVFNGVIKFPIVGDDDQYDISLFATGATTHVDHDEVRFGDGSVDMNSSTGSNSLLLTKVVYQYTNLTLTISTYSPNGTIETGSQVNDTVAVYRGLGLELDTVNQTPFSISCAVTTNTKSYQIIKQPDSNDFIAFTEPNIESAPVAIPGENIYPTATADFTGDDVNGAVTSGAIVEIDADVAGNVAIGDKITTTVMTDTVNGAVTSGIKVVMDVTVAGKMAVGDQVTGNTYLNANLVTVAALNPDGDNDSEFSMSEAVAIADGITLSFSSKINRSLTTVESLDPAGEAKQFTMSQDIQFRDNAPLTFFNQKNFRWLIDDISKLSESMIVVDGGNITTDSIISKYQDTITLFPDTDKEEVIVKYEVDALDTLAKKPTILNGLVSVQPGAITFDKQQVLALAGDTLKIGGYGQKEVRRVFGYEVALSDLVVTLPAIITTTTSAVSNSTSVPVAERNGIVNTYSTVSGIGINPSLADPTVSSGGGATGAGTLVLSAAQTLEDGMTLTFGTGGQTAVITGNIEILKAGTSNQTLRLDVEKLLSIT